MTEPEEPTEELFGEPGPEIICAGGIRLQFGAGNQLEQEEDDEDQ